VTYSVFGSSGRNLRVEYILYNDVIHQYHVIRATGPPSKTINLLVAASVVCFSGFNVRQHYEAMHTICHSSRTTPEPDYRTAVFLVIQSPYES
jgi:hypothetical protein